MPSRGSITTEVVAETTPRPTNHLHVGSREGAGPSPTPMGVLSGEADVESRAPCVAPLHRRSGGQNKGPPSAASYRLTAASSLSMPRSGAFAWARQRSSASGDAQISRV